MGQEVDNTNETDGFEVHLTEAVDPAPQDQENKGDDSATTQEKGEGQPDDQGKPKEEGQDGAEQQPNADDAGAESQPKNRGRSRLQKRIDRLTRRNKEMEAKLAEVEAGKKPADKPADSKNTGTEPDPTDFDSYDDYLDSLADWKAGNKKPDEKKPDESDDKGNGDKPEVDQEYVDALEDVKEAFEDTRKQYDDFDQVIGAEDLAITSDMVKALAETDNPGAIAYHLGKNKAEASRIAGLSPLAQAREIGKLEVSVANKKPLGKKTTEAPEPIEPVRGADSSSKTVDQMDFAEYERTMNEKDRSKGSFW